MYGSSAMFVLFFIDFFASIAECIISLYVFMFLASISCILFIFLISFSGCLCCAFCMVIFVSGFLVLIVIMWLFNYLFYLSFISGLLIIRSSLDKI